MAKDSGWRRLAKAPPTELPVRGQDQAIVGDERKVVGVLAHPLRQRPDAAVAQAHQDHAGMSARRLLVVDADARPLLSRITLALTQARVKEGVGRSLIPADERPLPEIPALPALTPGIRVNAIDERLGPEN